MKTAELVERRDSPGLPFLVELAGLVGGIGIAAFGLAQGMLLVAVPGFFLLLVALFLLLSRAANAMKANQPPIKPAAIPVSAMKDQPIGKDTP